MSADRAITVAGIRDISPQSEPLIEDAIRRLCGNVSCFIFGGARGVDTLALIAAARLYPSARRIVIVPGLVAQQPREAQRAIEQHATEVEEMRQSLSDSGSMFRRTARMLDLSSGLLSFPDTAADLSRAYRNGDGGTFWGIKEAQRRGMACRIVRVQRF